jgi:RNase P/RNase MRP subunit p29
MNKVTYSEIIGAEAEVVYSADPTLLGIRGLISGEGKNTIRILAKGKELTLLKWNVTLKILTDSRKEVIVSSSDIEGRPEERTKTVIVGRRR